VRTFKDSKGRDWKVEVNVAAVKRIKDLADIDLIDSNEGAVFHRLAEDPIALCDVIYAVCKPQADADGITDEEFGSAMGGDVIDAATEAFLEELIDFFPSRRRPIHKKALAKYRKLEGMALASADKALEGDTLEKALAKELEDHDLEASIRQSFENARTTGPASTASPEASASTPDP